MGDAEEGRGQWGNKWEFLMAIVAMSVGLGNVWRFAFTAYENGGGAFLLPYLIVVVLVGRPIYFLEMSLGQFVSKGNFDVFDMMGYGYRGVGFAQFISCMGVLSYYSYLLSLILFYFLASFTTDLPWQYCRKEWESWLAEHKIQCVPSAPPDDFHYNDSLTQSGSAELYYLREVLKVDYDSSIGIPDLRLTLLLILTYTICFILLWRGIESTGKASYFLALFPYVAILVLMCKAITLSGSSTGMKYFIQPKWGELLKARVWYYAITQCFFSINIGNGTIIMYASYNPFRHKFQGDVIAVLFFDTLMSIMAGLTIFAVLGHLAHVLHTSVDEVANGGLGLAFISYPEAIVHLKQIPYVFAILFFFMMLTLGFGSVIAFQGVAITLIVDRFNTGLEVWKVTLLTGIGGFLISFIYVTPAGQFWLESIDFACGTFVCYIAAMSEVLAVIFIYGMKQYLADLEFMLEKKTDLFTVIDMLVIAPLGLVFVFIYFLATIKRQHFGDVVVPWVVEGTGWAIVVLCLILTFCWPIIYLVKNRKEKPCKELVHDCFTPSNWVPATKEDRDEYNRYIASRG